MNKEGLLGKRDIQAIEALKLYYRAGKSQQEIAGIMGISRPTVASLLQYAAEQGYLEIRINDPREDHTALAQCIRRQYGLQEVRVAPVQPGGSYGETLQAVGAAGARMMEGLVGDNDTIAIEWSSSIQAVAQALNAQQCKNVKVVQLRGSDTQIRQGLNEAESTNLICQAFNAVGETLPLPAVFDNVHTKNLVEQENHIRRVLERAKNSRIAVFTVGIPQRDSLLFQSGFFSEEEIRHLMQHAAGSICARFLDSKGRVCLPDLNNRTTGIALPDLRHKEQRVLIAAGAEKAAAVRVALKYGYANRLVTDSQTANLLLS